MSGSLPIFKGSLMKEPILRYLDPKKLFVIFTDTSKWTWACLLTQSSKNEVDGKKTEMLYPINYVTCGTQM